LIYHKVRRSILPTRSNNQIGFAKRRGIKRGRYIFNSDKTELVQNTKYYGKLGNIAKIAWEWVKDNPDTVVNTAEAVYEAKRERREREKERENNQSEINNQAGNNELQLQRQIDEFLAQK
jgi:hypothetical protein